MKTPLTPEEFVKLARGLPPDERVPYAFEKRIMARLSGNSVADAVSLWTHILWRAVAPCLGIMFVALAIGLGTTSSMDNTDDSTDLEAAVYAPTQLAFGENW